MNPVLTIMLGVVLLITSIAIPSRILENAVNSWYKLFGARMKFTKSNKYHYIVTFLGILFILLGILGLS